ncbi:MAG TPA: alpha-L-fucosidase [Fimbriimonas sp.]|nr:alpha-L-fucosidase [Fimbriimonas sp.]
MSEERLDVITHTASIEHEKPQWLRERLEWFEDQKFGLLLHWGPYAHWDCCESWPLSPGDDWARNDNMVCWTSRGKDLARFQADYWALNKQFNPTQYDPEAWADAVAEAGIRYVSLTAKHHDGFCMWDTKETEYKITGPDSPYQVDIYKGFCEAFQRRGLGISVYFSKADWHSPAYWSPTTPVTTRQANTVGTPLWDEFVRFTHAQISELMTGYGKVDVLWLDAGWVKKERGEDLDMEGMIGMARALQPGLIVANRTVGDEFEDFITPEHQIPDEPLGQTWESCLCMGTSWKYEVGDVFRPVGEILRMLIEIVSKGGNFLIGFGPAPDGTFPTGALERLKEIGAWMKVNGEGIFGSRAISPYFEGGVRFTQKGDQIFAFLVDEDTDQLETLRPSKDSELRVLGCAEPVLWRELDGRCKFELPSEAAHLPHPLTLSFSKT